MPEKKDKTKQLSNPHDKFFREVWSDLEMDQSPETLSLMRSLMEKESGLEYLETVLRYLFATVDNVSHETFKEIVVQTFSKREGDYVMTLAEKLHMQGREEGKKEGLQLAIELGITLKFPDKAYMIISKIKKIDDLDLLSKITEVIKTATNESEILELLN